MTSFRVGYFANRITGQRNYLELLFRFKSTSITWFVLEFESRDADLKSVLGATESLVGGLDSGGRVPCSFDSSGSFKPSAGAQLVCTYFKPKREGTRLSSTHRIFVANFQITSTTTSATR